MPVKNASTTTWYKPPPVHHAPSATRHGPQQATQSQSKPMTHVPGGHHPHHAPHQSPGSPKHMPSIPSTGLPCPSQSSKQTTQVPSSQVPPSGGSRVPGGLSTQVPPLLPSKLPTSTSSTSISTPTSPKRSLPQPKIASPTRQKNTDRLPPISKGTTALMGVEQGDVTGLKPVTPGQKVKGRDGKEAKEKLNENRVRRSSSESSSPHLRKGNRENSRKLKGSENDSGNTSTTSTAMSTRRKNLDNKLDTKANNAIIPKRKKSERSHSDHEIKPKKINIRELPAISSEVEDMQDKTITSTTSTTTSTTITTTSTKSPLLTSTPTTTTTTSSSRSPSKDRSNSCSVRSPEKTAPKMSRQNRKITPRSPSPTSNSSPSSSSSNLKLRTASSTQVSRKETTMKEVEKMLKEMDVGKEVEKDSDETALGKSIERSLEDVLSARAESEMAEGMSEVTETMNEVAETMVEVTETINEMTETMKEMTETINEMDCSDDRVGEEELEEEEVSAMVCDDEEAKDVCMEDESVEGDYNVEEEEVEDGGKRVCGDEGNEISEGGGGAMEDPACESAIRMESNKEVGDAQRSSGMVLPEGAVFLSESHGQQVEGAPASLLLIDDAEDDAATDQSMRDEESIRDDRSMVDVVEISEQIISVEEEEQQQEQQLEQQLEQQHQQQLEQQQQQQQLEQHQHLEQQNQQLGQQHIDVDDAMEDGTTLLVELSLDGTVEDIVLMDEGDAPVSSVKDPIPSRSAREKSRGEEKERKIIKPAAAKTSVRKIDDKPGKTGDDKSGETGEKIKPVDKAKDKDRRAKGTPKTVIQKKAPEKGVKRDLSSKREAKTCDESKNKKKEEEEEAMKLSERRTKRKMDAEKTRGGTKKPAILFVDKDVDKLATTSRPVSPCPSDVSSSSDQSHTSNLSHVSSRLPIRALHVSGRPGRTGSVNSLCSTASGEGGDSRASRESHVLTSNRVNISNGEKKRSEATAPPRRPRLDNIKSTIPKPGRLPPRKLTDPVKAARPGGPPTGPRGPHHLVVGGHGGSGGGERGAPGQQHERPPPPHVEQLRRLEAELTARATELKAARAEREHAERGVEALTVLIHHLTNNYEPFSCPRLKAEVVRLNQQLTETRLSLDESTAAVRRLQEEAAQSVELHGKKVQELEQRHRQALEQLIKQHQHDLDLTIEKHRKELSKIAEEQQAQREDLSRAHAAEIERLEGEWRTKLDVQHEKHLCAVQELNTTHTQQLRELESSRQAREFELEETNFRLKHEQEALKVQSRKLEESLLNDTDHRLQAVRNMCSSLKSEVDSLKTVVEMKNSEIHTLRGQVVEMGRLSKELEVARDRAKSLQAKTEDLQAQMEKRALSERHLVNEHRLLVETCQREANINKRLSLENEELAWKLRQREEMYTSLPSSTLDLVSRSPATPRRQEGASSPQAAPHSPRVAVRSPSGKISPSKCEVSKRRSRLGLSPEDGVNGDDRVQDVSIDSPPPSPCVKAVVEKSNSVSFILDLNDSQSDDSFLDLPPSPRPRPQRTASLSAADRPRTPIHARRVIHNNRANSLNRNGVNLEGRQKETGKSEFNGKRKEVNGKQPHDTNGHGSHPSSGRSASESSEGGSEMERVSPTGLAWTVPVHSPKSPVKTNSLRQNGSPVRGRLEHHLLEDPDEDEYEETTGGTHQFIEVVELSRVGLVSSSEAASDSELSQCDLIKGGSSTDSDSESSDGETHTQQGPSKHREQLGRKNGPWCPKEGAGEAMITDDLLKPYHGASLAIEPLPSRGKRPPRRCFPSAPSSDSDDNMNAHNEGTAVDVSWSEDITSSSEMHEL